MSEHVSLDDFLQKISMRFDSDVDEGTYFSDLNVDIEDFIDFLKEEFILNSKQKGIMRNEIKEDSLLMEIFDVIFE